MSFFDNNGDMGKENAKVNSILDTYVIKLLNIVTLE